MLDNCARVNAILSQELFDGSALVVTANLPEHLNIISALEKSARSDGLIRAFATERLEHIVVRVQRLADLGKPLHLEEDVPVQTSHDYQFFLLARTRLQIQSFFLSRRLRLTSCTHLQSNHSFL